MAQTPPFEHSLPKNVPSEKSVGIFFSANDSVFEWVVAFLESLRQYNPNLPCRLIPFNSDCQRVISLASRYQFEIFEHPSFGLLEDIGSRLELGHTPHGKYWFRRFAAFDGEFERFAYFDARSLILSDFDEYFELCRVRDLDLLHFDCAVNQVYNDGEIRKSFVIEGRGRGFNSGRWFSRKGLFSERDFLSAADVCENNRSQMNARNTDQFFLNYLCDSLKVRMAQLPDLDSRYCSVAWARQPGYVYESQGRFCRWDHGGLDHKKLVPFLHWAGIGLSPAMPEANWFYHFRDRPEKSVYRLTEAIRRMPIRISMKFIQSLRTQRQFNQLWHSVRRS